MQNKPTDFVKYLFHNGELSDAYRYLGCHLVFTENKKIMGASFCVYAPYAREISVVGDFNN